MENLNTDQVLNWALIIIALGAVAWAALQNWFFNNNRNRYNQFPPYYPPYGAYPQQQGADYPQMHTPRRSSPFLTIVLITIVGIALYTWAKDIKPSGNSEQVLTPDYKPNTNRIDPDQSTMIGSTKDSVLGNTPQTDDTKKENPIQSYGDDQDAPSGNSGSSGQAPRVVPEEKTVPETGFSVQVAALERDGSFERLAAELLERYPKASIFRHFSILERDVIGDKLLIGRFPTREEAVKGAKKLRALGYEGCFPVDFEELDMDQVEVYEP